LRARELCRRFRHQIGTSLRDNPVVGDEAGTA